MTETCPTQTSPKDFTAEKQPMSGVFPLITLESTICTAMLWNGAAIGGTKTTTTHQLTEVPGKLVQMIAECSVAVLGTILRSIVAVTFVTGAGLTMGGGTGVFALQ